MQVDEDFYFFMDRNKKQMENDLRKMTNFRGRISFSEYSKMLLQNKLKLPKIKFKPMRSILL